MKVEVPRYPHVRVVDLPSGRLMVQIAWDKKREVTMLGTRITVVPGKRASNYGVYEKDVEVGTFETDDIEIDGILRS